MLNMQYLSGIFTCFVNTLLFQKSIDSRTAVYKQLLGDHCKISDKYKAAEKELGFTKSKFLLSRVIFCLPR